MSRFRTETIGKVTAIHGDSREVLGAMAADSIDSVVCDPPYALVSIGKRFGADNAAPAKPGKSGAYARASAGFMGQKWDTGETAFDPEFWREVLRVLKPGGHVVAFGSTRTFHRLVVAIEDAGFEIRDTLCWHFGSGFPKSHDPKKGARETVCRCPPGDNQLRGLRREPDHASGLGAQGESADLLAPVQRRSARSRMGSARPQGLGGSADHAGYALGEEPGLEGRSDPQAAERELQGRALCQGAGVGEADGASGRLHHGASACDGADVRPAVEPNGSGEPRGPQPGEQRAGEPDALSDERRSQAGGGWPLCPRCLQPVLPDGLGTALKPATELICLARKPLAGTVAANILQFRTGALNIDGTRIEAADNPATWETPRGGIWSTDSTATAELKTSDKGRWPANVVHDGSGEVESAFPESAGQQGDVRGTEPSSPTNGIYGDFAGRPPQAKRGDSGSAARFFYSAKADAEDRLGSRHPTVKPVDLMAWLCRLVTPPGGAVLDPFAGSGTTGLAAMREGFTCFLIEREETYFADITRRLAWATGEGRTTALEMARLDTPDALAKAAGEDLPLFGEATA